MSQTSTPPSPTFTADSGLHRGGIHEPSPMLESYLSEEPTVTARLLIAEKRDVDKGRLEAAQSEEYKTEIRALLPSPIQIQKPSTGNRATSWGLD